MQRPEALALLVLRPRGHGAFMVAWSYALGPGETPPQLKGWPGSGPLHAGS